MAFIKNWKKFYAHILHFRIEVTLNFSFRNSFGFCVARDYTMLQIVYLYTQCAAVRTCLSVINTPPQYWIVPCRRRAAIHGHSLGSAGWPPAILIFVFVVVPQPLGLRGFLIASLMSDKVAFFCEIASLSSEDGPFSSSFSSFHSSVSSSRPAGKMKNLHVLYSRTQTRGCKRRQVCVR